MKVGALDLGSNTIKLLVADRDASGAIQPIHENAIVTRLAEGLGVDSAELKPEAVARTLRGLASLLDEARTHGAERIECVATAGLRAVGNPTAFLERARSQLGLEVTVIDGLREGQLAFRGACGWAPRGAVVVDVGGRSTEVVTGTGGKAIAQVSLPIGGLNLTQEFLHDDPPSDRQMFDMRVHIRRALRELPRFPDDGTLIGVSGTFVSLLGYTMGIGKLRSVIEEGEGHSLTLGDVHHAYEMLRKVPARRRLMGDVIPEGRADIIVAGTAIILEVLLGYEQGRVLVTRRGLRYGLAAEILEKV